jgi:hypothetical protein
LITKEKRKRKETTKKTLKSDRKLKERQRARSLEEEQVSDPLGKGNSSTHSGPKTMLKQRAQTTNPKFKQHQELPLHTCKLPLSQSTLPRNQCSNATKSKNLLTLPRAVRPPLWDLTACGAVRLPQETGPAPNFS